MTDISMKSPPGIDGRRQRMRTPDEVIAILRLHDQGWGTRRIAREVGCDRETVKRYLAQGRWASCRVARRPGMLDEHAGWIAERFTRHHGNADVVRQDLASELGVVASLRTVERAVCHLRRELAAATLATVRFETPPGRQLQIDFGQRRIVLEDGEVDKVFLFVATLGYSRRIYVQAFRHERQSAWLEGIEGAFRHFGGLPGELLLDNAAALVRHHDAALLHRSADWPRERPGVVRQPLPLTWDALCRSKPMPTVATASPGKGSRSRTGATTMPACVSAGA